MSEDTSHRKRDHINICLNEDISFRTKTNGFEKYDFIHNAVTTQDFTKIDLATKFLNYKISFPFMISCMTGGTKQAENINEMLSTAANMLKIPVGVGSQRQALENDSFHDSYKVIRKNAKDVPVVGNIGGAEVARMKSLKEIRKLVDLVEADAMVVHLNPLQELIQPEGNRNFSGLLKKIEKLVKLLDVPVIAKEVGSGIEKSAAKKLLDAGCKGIDVAGAGGTSWSAVEMKRKNNPNENENYLWDWGLPTSYCVRTVSELKKKYKFTLIASGGITSGIDISKALALGADITASARPIFIQVMDHGFEGVVDLIESWFEDVKKIMFLTGSKNIGQLNRSKIIKSEAAV